MEAGVVIFGMAAIWLTNCTAFEVRRWGPVMGLISQPFWFWEMWSAGKYGIFACSIVYAWSWWRGFRRDWITKGGSNVAPMR